MEVNEKLNKIKSILGLSKEEPKVKEEVKETVELMEEEAPKEDVKKAEEPVASYATMEQLSAVKEELLSLIEAIIEVNKKDTKEVPQELSKQEPKVELAEEKVEEIKHSPESEVEKEKVVMNVNFANMTPLERIQFSLNN